MLAPDYDFGKAVSVRSDLRLQLAEGDLEFITQLPQRFDGGFARLVIAAVGKAEQGVDGAGIADSAQCLRRVEGGEEAGCVQSPNQGRHGDHP